MAAKYAFNAAERLGVYEAHGHKCFLCGRPLETYRGWHVDHLIPESTNAAKLAELRQYFGLPDDFELNSFENWVPAHNGCNQEKDDGIYKVPAFLTFLRKARDRAPEARRRAKAEAAAPNIFRFFAALEIHGPQIMRNPEHRARLLAEIEQYTKLSFIETASGEVREATAAEANTPAAFSLLSLPLQIDCDWAIIRTEGHIASLRSPNGTSGYMNIDANAHFSFFCHECGAPGIWNGARCIPCGRFGDD